MDRRQALKNIGLSFGAITITPALSSVIQSCQSNTGWIPKVLTGDEANLVAEIMDIILPSSEALPGATDLNLIQFVDTYMDLAVEDKSIEEVKMSLQKFKEVTLSDNQKSEWNAITKEEIEGQIAKYLKPSETIASQWWKAIQEAAIAADESGAATVLDAEPAAFAVTREIRSLAVNAYKGSEYIGEQVLAYAPVPGQQKGCVDLMETTGGKAWSL